MFLECYQTDSVSCFYEHSRAGCTRSNAFLAVETCSKGVLAPSVWHGKSPCFLRCALLRVVGVDGRVSVFDVTHGSKLLECAF
jgi:hypothetical protein